MPKKTKVSKLKEKTCRNSSGMSSMEVTNIEPESSTLGHTAQSQFNLAEKEIEVDMLFQDLINKVKTRKVFALKNLELAFAKSLLLIPESILNTPVELNDEPLHILKDLNLEDCNSDPTYTATSNQTDHKRRRSRSATGMQSFQSSKGLNTRTRKRSTSLNVYKTPRNKILLEELTTAKKYTVSKPPKVEDSGITVKRVMKPDEEAISISGSPLLVQPTIASAPTISIPLPGGVVMNIQPKKAQPNRVILDLDERTRKQLKLLEEQLKNLL